MGAKIARDRLHDTSAIKLVEDAIGSELSKIEVVVFATAANPEASRLLGIKPGGALLVRRHKFWSDERVILCGESIFRGDAYRFTYNSKRR